MPRDLTSQFASRRKLLAKTLRTTRLEKLGVFIEALQFWLVKSWQIGMVMARGAYLLSERKQLYFKLGQDVFHKFEKGELYHASLESIVSEIKQLTQRIEAEEVQVRQIRFGKKNSGSGMPPDFSAGFSPEFSGDLPANRSNNSEPPKNVEPT